MTDRFRSALPRAVFTLTIALASSQIIWAQEDAMDRLRDEIAAHPERLDLVMELGNAAVGAGKFDTAVASFRKVLQHLEPDSEGAGDIYLRLGETYRRQGDSASAIAALTRASQLLPDQPVVLGTLALVLDAGGKTVEAERAYRAALHLDPDNAIAMNNLAFLLAAHGGNLDEALGLVHRAGELLPEDPDVIDTAGWVQLKRKHTTVALALFAKIVAQAPDNDGYRQHLLLALQCKSEHTTAMDELETLLTGQVSPSNLRKIAELLAVLEPGETR